MRCLLLAFALLGLAPGIHAHPATVGFAFVMWGEGSDGQPVAMARAVVEGAADCPVLRRASGASQGMTARQRPPGGQFEDVLVCETIYPMGEAAAVLVGSRQLMLPTVSAATPRRVLVMGDSGCRGEVEHKPQSCAGAGFDGIWPFGIVASEEARLTADLIVHVGDYNYRNTPRHMVVPSRSSGYDQPLTAKLYDTGDLDDEDVPEVPIGPGYWSQNMRGSPIPDTWPAWREDFFVPAARLLGAAPWLFVRGNHELCSRAGPGWFYLLDPASSLLGGNAKQDFCPDQTPVGWPLGAWPKPPALPFQGEALPLRFSPPFRLKLGELDIISVDSANAGDAYLYNVDTYAEQYRRIGQILSERRPTWIVTHRPIWGVVKRSKGATAGSEPYGFINVSQQQALGKAFPDGLPSNVTAVLAGHMHRFQAIGFGDRRPPQLIVGTAGVELSHVQPEPPSVDDKKPILVPRLDGVDAWVVGLMDFGAMLIEPGRGGAWIAAMISSTGQTLAACDSTWPRQGGDRSVCRLR